METRKTLHLTPLGRVRFASVEDVPLIMKLVNDSMARNFRVHDVAQIVYLIENCVLSICQLDIRNELVGFLSLRDYPLIPSVHPAAWEEYVWTKYKSTELNSRNSLFIHLACWSPMYAREVIDNMLKSVFMHEPYLHHIGMVKSLLDYPLLIPGQPRAEASFRRVNCTEKGVAADSLPYLLVADRSEVCPRLKIRRAVEEDNDDIVPILEAHSARLRELYGDYYVSELVARHPESERVLLVCEHKEVAVGVMCLNTVVNLEALEESFELSPFCGLRKLQSQPKSSCLSKDVDVSQLSVTSPRLDESGPTLVNQTLPRKDAESRITWVFGEEKAKVVIEKQIPISEALSNANPQLDLLHLLEEEESEIEFDIVNIDTALLRVPQILSYDRLLPGPVEAMKKIIENSHKGNVEETSQSKRGSVSASSASHAATEPLRYSGKSNVFLLELFAMHRDYDERYGFDMLEVAFEIFPDRDYCMICLPSKNACFPLLEHFTLVTPYNNSMRFINETLFVTHVNSVRGNLRVRPGEAYDLCYMADVCEHAPLVQSILDLFESSLISPDLESYVVTSENQPVGVVMLGPLEDGTSVRTQFELEPEPKRPGTDGMILTAIISPVFEPHYRWFLRELMRLSKYSTLFWASRLAARGDNNPVRNLSSVAGHMTPVHPRRHIPNISGSKELDKVYANISVPFALWVLERPMTSLPKVHVNSSVVVVGASRTGLAFLETLLLGPTCEYLTFTNVTLVSEHGLPVVNECLKAAATCVPSEGRYTDRYLKSIPFSFYVDIMTAVMIGIDRKKKCIYLKGGGVKFYDQLILTCGMQFQHPEHLHKHIKLANEVEMGKPCERLLMDNPKYIRDKMPQAAMLPDNVFLVNCLYEANIVLRQLLRMINESSKESGYYPIKTLSFSNPVIVYGDFVEAYSCLAALLELGVTSDKIVYIEPFPADDPNKLRVNCFNDEVIDQRVQARIKDLGIRVYRSYFLTGWQCNENYIESVDLMSLLHYMKLPCFALFYYGFKVMDVHAFNAINQCGLVYDGGLVMDSCFETNDPHVHGAGACVKYSRKLYAAPHAHQFYNSEDVGEALARQFLKKMDPFVMAKEDEQNLMPRYSSTLINYPLESHLSMPSVAQLSACATNMPAGWKPVLRFESPIVVSATLPGPLYYLKVRKPGFEIPMEVQLSLPHQGHRLKTDKNGNYFCLQLNDLHCVEAVTCLSHKQFSTEILSQLYGKHEAFFNKLLVRFKMGLIPDLYEFFTQPWMSAMYQETFADLLRDINEREIDTIYDLVCSKFDSLEEEVSPNELQGTLCGCGCLPEATLKRAAAVLPECGQTEDVRTEAASLWKSIGGDGIVASHIAAYLNKTSVINSHYAVPDHKLL